MYDLSPLWVSLKTASIATIFIFFLGIAAASWMSGYSGKGKALIEGVFIAPLVLPPTVVGFLLLLLFGKNGPIGEVLQHLGINILFSWFATVIAAVVVAFPLMYKTALGAIAQIDPNILRAARTLGSSEWTIFWRITLPLAWPGILAGTILSFARALGEFGATLMLAGNIPGQTQTIPMAIFFATEAGDFREALFWVLIILAISLSVIASVNLWSDRSLKGEGRREKGEGRREKGEGEKRGRGEGEKRGRGAGEKRGRGAGEKRGRGEGEKRGLFVEIEKPLSNFSLSVDFSTNEGALGVLGGSGSGKSMTLRCIAGLETPSQGQIVLNGRVLFDSQKNINVPSCDRNIGFLFQNYALFPHLTVAENIAFGLQKLPKKERDRIVAETLALVQLHNLENRYPHHLSGGQQQRVALARAIAIKPAALLLDEPFSALDTHLRSQMEKLLVETLSNYPGITLFVTHNLEEAYRICKHLLVLSEGKIMASGRKEAIFARPNSLAVAQLTGCKNISKAKIISSTQIEALDWKCCLQVIEPIPPNLAYVGIRAHYLILSENTSQANTFPVWLVQASETPFRMTLYLKLNSPPAHVKDYCLQAEIYKEKWVLIKDKSWPLQIHLDPLQLFMMG